MSRAGADMREAESFEDLADRALMIMDAEALGDDALEIDAPPAHDAMHHPIRASLDEVCEFGLLISTEAGRRALGPVVQKPVGATLVEPMNPITQGLLVHAANPRRAAEAQPPRDPSVNSPLMAWRESYGTMRGMMWTEPPR